MGTGTNLMIAAGEDKFFDICDTVLSTLQKTVMDEFQRLPPEENTLAKSMIQSSQQDKFSHPELTAMGNMDCILVSFETPELGARDLKIISKSHGDDMDTYSGDKTYLKLGFWGASEKILRILAEALNEEHSLESYLVVNDCEGEYEKIF